MWNRTTSSPHFHDFAPRVVYLLRHAAPPAEARGRYWGKRNPGVDPDSLASVRDLLPLFWRKPDVVLSSPLARAAATASVAADVLAARVEGAADLAEVDFGWFDGLSFAEAARRHPERVAEWERLGDAYAFPGGESIQGWLERMDRAWTACLARPEEAVLAVTHGGVIAAWCCLFLRLPLARRFVFRADYAALTAFVRKRDDSGWELVFFNNRG